jgi:hypothetical protein
VRALNGSDLVQAKDGSSSGAATAPVALDWETTADTTLIAVIKGSSGMFQCDGWDLLAQDSSHSGTRIFAKSPANAGETAWTFGYPGIVSANWAWRIEEWRNVRWGGPLLTSGCIDNVVAPVTIDSGISGAADWPYVMAIAAWSLQIGGTTGTFPGIAGISDGFTEVAQVAAGSGSAPLDAKLYIARYFGTQDEPGPWASTVTLTGSIAGTTGAGALAVIAAGV